MPEQVGLVQTADSGRLHRPTLLPSLMPLLGQLQLLAGLIHSSSIRACPSADHQTPRPCPPLIPAWAGNWSHADPVSAGDVAP